MGKKNISNGRVLAEAIERYFLKSYIVKRMTQLEPVDLQYKSPDLVFIRARRDNLHVVEVKSTLSKAFGRYSGFNQLRRYKGNYKWLALHKD